VALRARGRYSRNEIAGFHPNQWSNIDNILLTLSKRQYLDARPASMFVIIHNQKQKRIVPPPGEHSAILEQDDS
jgi:hypothetical protein